MPDYEAWDNGVDVLLETLKTMGRSEEYSDMRVRLRDGTELRCHRNIVCTQSLMIKDELNYGSKASKSGIVEMLDYPPEAVKALIGFFYTAQYAIDWNQDVLGLIRSRLDVLKLATTHGSPELRDLAAQFITDQFVRVEHQEAAAKAFPDIAGAFEELDIDWAIGWNRKWDPADESAQKYDSFEDWARCHTHLLMEKDTGDALEEKAPILMEGLMEENAEWWFEYGCESGAEWIERFNGPGSSGALKYTFECPNRECRYIQTRLLGIFFFGQPPAMLECDICHCDYEYEKWMEFVKEPANEVNE